MNVLPGQSDAAASSREIRSHRILVVDDEKSVCEMIGARLEADGYQVVTECDPQKVLGLLCDRDYDVLLLDLVMPRLSGLELLVQIRLEFSALAIIVLTGHASLEYAIEAMRSGASDFVAKPVQPALLELRIQRALEFERARRLANTDGLTGLYNHRFFQERLQEEIGRAERYGRSLSLIMIDIDGFKSFNDTYGHLRGDEVLMALADVMGEVCRGSDVLARYGGEEFCLILPETTSDQAKMVAADRLRERMALARGSAGEDGSVGAPTLSLGISVHRPGMHLRRMLLTEADDALYRSKSLGGNRVTRYEAERELDRATGGR